MTTPAPDHDDLELAYLQRRQVHSQWAPFLAALAAELSAVADEAGTAAFMRATGARVARQHPLGKLETLEELELRINAVLAHMDWGWTQLDDGGTSIIITHGACPNVLANDKQGLWPVMMAEVLAGAYGAWLSEQGSPGRETTCHDPRARPLVFEHRT
jgi:hypothetical protein